MKNPWLGIKRKTSDELADEVEKFLANGGEIITLKDDDGSYDKCIKKNKKNFEGGAFNPFSKVEALSKKK